MLPTTCHVYFGEVCLASADGRGEGQPVSEGISPVQGADRHGPTAVLKSASKMDHVKTGGTLLNMKFTPALLEGDGGIDSLHSLVRSYFKLDGHHMQFNVVTADTLREAQGRPGGAPRPHRPRGRLQRLLLRPVGGAAGRDHPADRARGVLSDAAQRASNSNSARQPPHTVMPDRL